MYKIHEEENGNKIIGTYPELKKSTITFEGKNNILFCEDNVTLSNSNIKFRGDNTLIYLRSSKHAYILNATIFNDSVLHFGTNTYTNQSVRIILSEQKHCFVGDDCIFSTGIVMRNADPHLVYNCADGARLNPSRSIYIGDHVWVGQDSLILKGSQIDSGSIIGAGSVVAGKKVPHNTTWAGNPCKKIKDGVFWDVSCVHTWTEEKTEISQSYEDFIKRYKIKNEPDAFIFECNDTECIPWADLESKFSPKFTPMEKLEYISDLHSKKTKNRFVHS